jgi:hypothetical protein
LATIIQKSTGCTELIFINLHSSTDLVAPFTKEEIDIVLDHQMVLIVFLPEMGYTKYDFYEPFFRSFIMI